jgi:hypothetical protein
VPQPASQPIERRPVAAEAGEDRRPVRFATTTDLNVVIADASVDR